MLQLKQERKDDPCAWNPDLLPQPNGRWVWVSSASHSTLGSALAHWGCLGVGRSLPSTNIHHPPTSHKHTHIMQEIHPYTTMVLILRTCTLEWLPSNRHFIHMWVLKLMRSKLKCTCISVLPCSEDMFMIESVIPIIRLNLWNLCISSFTEHEALHPKHHSPSRIRTTALCYK